MKRMSWPVGVQVTIQQLREQLERATESQADERARAEHAESLHGKLQAQVSIDCKCVMAVSPTCMMHSCVAEKRLQGVSCS